MNKKIIILILSVFIMSIFPFPVLADNSVVYVKDGGNGSGSSVSDPVSDMEKAFSMLPEGGTVVICGKVTATSIQCQKYSGTITVTSVYNGTDYRKDGARLSFRGSEANAFSLGGDTVFDNMILEVTSNSARTITCNGNKVIFGNGVECTRTNNSFQWLGITMGSFANGYLVCDDTQPGELTVNSGNWQIIRLGNRGSKITVIGDIKFTLNGGTVYGNIIGCTAAPVDGNVYITVNGGEIRSAQLTPGASVESTEVSDNVYLEINGGRFVGTKITVSNAHGLGGVRGMGSFVINGGEFSSGASVSVGAHTGPAKLYVNTDVVKDISFIKTEGFELEKGSGAKNVSDETSVPDTSKQEAEQNSPETAESDTYASDTSEHAPPQAKPEHSALVPVIIGAVAAACAVAFLVVKLVKKNTIK